MRKILPLIALLSFLCGCSRFVSAPEITFQELKIVGIDTGGMSMDLHLLLKNTSSFDITLDGYTYDLSILDLPLAEGGVREPRLFAGGTENDVRIPVRIPHGNLLEIVKHRPDPDRIPYRLDSGLELRGPFGPMYVPIQQSGTFAIPEKYRPAFYLRKLKELFRDDPAPEP